MSFLLDTNIVSAHLRRPTALAHRFVQHVGRLAIPTVVLAELFAWAYGRPDPATILDPIRTLLAQFEILPFGPECAERFGQLRAELRRGGITVDAVDLMIASVALAHDLSLVTANTRHFAVIPGLSVVNWLEP